MQDEVVIKISPMKLEGFPCPACHGLGNLNDGSCSISATEFRYRPATKCCVCRGKGRVRVLLLEDEPA